MRAQMLNWVNNELTINKSIINLAELNNERIKGSECR